MEARQNYLFVKQAGGYVKALEKSTSPPSILREVFEHSAPNDQAGGRRQEAERRFEGSLYCMKW